MGSRQRGTARSEEVAEAAGGGEAGGGVELERLAELQVLLCTRAHELRSSATTYTKYSSGIPDRTFSYSYSYDRSGQHAQWRLMEMEMKRDRG